MIDGLMAGLVASASCAKTTPEEAAKVEAVVRGFFREGAAKRLAYAVLHSNRVAPTPAAH